MKYDACVTYSRQSPICPRFLPSHRVSFLIKRTVGALTRVSVKRNELQLCEKENVGNAGKGGENSVRAQTEQ